MAKPAPQGTTAYSSERFAHPFFVSAPPAARAPVHGARRMLEWSKTQLGPIPAPTNKGVCKLADFIGQTGTDEITQAGGLIFHALGDSGVNHATEAEAISDLMAGDFKPDKKGANPAFLMHLGDVVYGPDKTHHYGERFYRPYMHYPGKILGIAGNHDGEVKSPADSPSLGAFRANFCFPTPLPIAVTDHYAMGTQHAIIRARERATNLLHEEIVGDAASSR
jgi:calcineurin-like phosphoesterase family protein